MLEIQCLEKVPLDKSESLFTVPMKPLRSSNLVNILFIFRKDQIRVFVKIVLVWYVSINIRNTICEVISIMPDFLYCKQNNSKVNKPIQRQSTSSLILITFCWSPCLWIQGETESTDVSTTHTKLLTEFTNISDCSIQSSLDTTFRDFKSVSNSICALCCWFSAA